MKSQFKSESGLYVNFKHMMYAVMVIVVALAIPILSYMELSYNDDSAEQNNKTKVERNLSVSIEKENTAKL